MQDAGTEQHSANAGEQYDTGSHPVRRVGTVATRSDDSFEHEMSFIRAYGSAGLPAHTQRSAPVSLADIDQHVSVPSYDVLPPLEDSAERLLENEEDVVDRSQRLVAEGKARDDMAAVRSTFRA